MSTEGQRTKCYIYIYVYIYFFLFIESHGRKKDQCSTALTFAHVLALDPGNYIPIQDFLHLATTRSQKLKSFINFT